MSWRNYFESPTHVVATTQQLLQAGATERDLAASVRSGHIVRVRRGCYAAPDTDRHVVEAARVGGRLACVSAAAVHGIFAFDTSTTHMHLERSRSRLRAPGNSRRALTEQNRNGVAMHWSPLLDQADGPAHSVGVRDALAQIVRCQEERMAIAALDSALHQHLIDIEGVNELFAHLPRRFRRLRSRINGRSESGQESVLRLIVEEMGLDYEIQVSIDGVGRVDMVIAGVLVVEADSRAHHKEWDQHVRDRTRDRLVAAQGYMTLRLLYHDIMFDAAGVRAAIRGLLAARVGVGQPSLP